MFYGKRFLFTYIWYNSRYTVFLIPMFVPKPEVVLMNSLWDKLFSVIFYSGTQLLARNFKITLIAHFDRISFFLVFLSIQLPHFSPLSLSSTPPPRLSLSRQLPHVFLFLQLILFIFVCLSLIFENYNIFLSRAFVPPPRMYGINTDT